MKYNKKEYNKKYNKENYTQFKVNLKNKDYNNLEDLLKIHKLTKANLLRKVIIALDTNLKIEL